MKITNKFNLPEALVELAKNDRKKVPGRYSVTELLKGTREIVLERRHDEEIEVDVSELVASLIGTAFHEAVSKRDTTNEVEARSNVEVLPSVFLSGQWDLYNEETATIEDYKTTSVNKVKARNFEDWKKQGMMYAWLAKHQGKLVVRIRFHAIMKDWNRSKVEFEKDYPPNPVYTYEEQVTTRDLIEIEQFIVSKLTEIQNAPEMPEVCSDEERWYTGDKYAVMNPGVKRALKVFDTQEEAESYSKFYNGSYVEPRYGRNVKCESYCSVREFCPFYKKGIGK